MPSIFFSTAGFAPPLYQGGLGVELDLGVLRALCRRMRFRLLWSCSFSALFFAYRRLLLRRHGFEGFALGRSAFLAGGLGLLLACHDRSNELNGIPLCVCRVEAVQGAPKQSPQLYLTAAAVPTAAVSPTPSRWADLS
jgi:hypothetical protein